MKNKATAITAVAIVALMIQSAAFAEAPPPMGYNVIECPPSADLIVTMTWTADADASPTVTSTTGTELEVAAATFVDDEYNNGLFYVRMTSGGAAGRWSTILSNDGDAVVLQDTSFLGSVAPGDMFKVFPHATLGTLFPAIREGVCMVESVKHPTLPIITTSRTQVLVYDGKAAGQNPANTVTYFYFNDAWRRVGQPLTTSFNNAILQPDAYFILRNQNWPDPLHFVATGNLPFEVRSIVLTNGVSDDLVISSARPIAIELRELDLGGHPGFIDAVKHAVLPLLTSPGDQLLVFNNNGSGINIAADTLYYHRTGHWRKLGAGLEAIFDSDVIPAGSGIILRKNGAGAGMHVWTNRAPY